MHTPPKLNSENSPLENIFTAFYKQTYSGICSKCCIHKQGSENVSFRNSFQN